MVRWPARETFARDRGRGAGTAWRKREPRWRVLWAVSWDAKEMEGWAVGLRGDLFTIFLVSFSSIWFYCNHGRHSQEMEDVQCSTEADNHEDASSQPSRCSLQRPPPESEVPACPTSSRRTRSPRLRGRRGTESNQAIQWAVARQVPWVRQPLLPMSARRPPTSFPPCFLGEEETKGPRHSAVSGTRDQLSPSRTAWKERILLGQIMLPSS